jgi:Cdc6-like AAA superfamily ATPase
MSLETAFPALLGGLASTVTANYLGYDNPIVGILGASIGAAAVTNIQYFYNENKDVLPGSQFIRNISDKVCHNAGLLFYTVIIKKDEAVIYNKLESYILHKYSDILRTGIVGHNINMNISMSLNNCKFTKPVIDHYNGNRIFLIIKHNEIHIRSYTLEVSLLKDYIKTILTTSLGIRTILIHQPIFDIITDGKNNKREQNIKWESLNIQTNKNFKNTILTDNVTTELLEDLEKFMQTEEYYNNKGIPYKRGYLLYGPPGTGKTSILKAIASHYGMDIYVINIGDIREEQELIRIFQGTRNNNSYHMLCFEDVDRCEWLTPNCYFDNKHSSLIRTFLNELDGVIETSKRITFLTVNDKTVIERIPALCRPGRLDKMIELGYCDNKQISRLYNHFTESNEVIELKEVNENITPAQVVKYILNNPKMGFEDFKKQLKCISTIVITEESSFSVNKRYRNRRRFMTKITRYKRKLNKCKKDFEKLPKLIIKQEELVRKEEERIKRKKDKDKKKTIKKRKIN